MLNGILGWAARAATKKAEGTSEWSRRRLLGILAAAVAVAVLLLGGLAYAVYLAIAGIGDEASANTGVATGETERSTVARGAAHRDEIAAEPMLTVRRRAAFPGSHQRHRRSNPDRTVTGGHSRRARSDSSPRSTSRCCSR
ncbi:hypothetical protein I601_4159 [Nocardioides dokdonensis FR1436]|uniref:Uncharacterized protein n=2 Tax=Nocardioides TaxID=1839 RepID=A0A1A9GQF6_9ACTN|nr:hypothetical protein I601_4159 [Nocardioides dokdonensis FR1436]